MGEPVKGQMKQVMFPLVDDADFATVLSAITESDFNSAALRKFYGINNGVSDAFTSGTISKLGRLVRSGVFMLTIKGTENNYDEMTVIIQHPSAADQVLQWTNREYDQSDLMSRVSDLSSDLKSLLTLVNATTSDILSTMGSQFTVLNAAASNAYSAAVVGASRILLVQSSVSAMSAFLSDAISDMHSDLRSVLLVTGVSLTSDTMSNLRSAITAAGGGGGATPSALWAYSYSNFTVASTVGSLLRARMSTVSGIYSGISNLQSRVDSSVSSRSQLSDLMSDLRSMVATRSQLSDLHSDLRSFITADLYSQLSDFRSDLLSRLAITGVSLTSDVMSNLRSAIANATVTLTASDLSNIGSAVWAQHYAGHAAASTFGSFFGEMATSSDLVSQVWAHAIASDLISKVSDLRSKVIVMSDVLSDFYSDFQSRVPKLVATNSQLSDLHSDLRSFMTADLYSQLSDFRSDLLSLLATTGVTLTSDMQSNLRSAITAAGGGGGATASQIWTYTGDQRTLTASGASDIASAVWAHAVGTRVDSRLLVVQSSVSAVSALVSDMHSDLRSLLLTTGVSLTSDTMSNLRSAITAAGGGAGATASMVWTYAAGAGRTLTTSLATSSDLVSKIWGYSSKIVSLDSATMSDVRSAITAGGGGGATPSAIWGYGYSDLTEASSIGSLLRGRLSTISAIYSGISNLQSRVDSNVASRSQVSDLQSDLKSLLTLVNATTSDILSTMGSQFTVLNLAASNAYSAAVLAAAAASNVNSVVQTASWMSDLASHVWTAKYTALNGPSSFGSALRLNMSRISDLQSYVSDMHSDLRSVLATRSQISDLMSDLRSYLVGISGALSDVDSALTSQFAYLSNAISDMHSDLASGIDTVSVTIGPSDISVIASQVAAAVSTIGPADISNIASAVWALHYATHQGASSFGSRLVDIHSLASNLNSRITGPVATASQLSDLASDLRSYLVGLSGTLSDVDSALTSQFTVTTATLSDLRSDLASRMATRSQLSDLHSDLKSFVAGRSQLSDLASDIKSAIAAGGLTSDAMSDIAVAVWNEHYATHLGASTFGSATMRGMSAASDAASAAQQANSRALTIYDLLSDVESQLDVTTATLSDFYSDFGSRVPGRVLVRTDAMAELTGVAPATPTQEAALMMMFMRERNNTKVTTTHRRIRNAAGTTIASAAIGDASNSFVQGTLA